LDVIQVELIEDQTQRVGDLQYEGVTFESQIGRLAKLVDRFVEVLSLVLTAREDLAHVCGVRTRWLNYAFVLVLTVVVSLSIRLLGIILVTSLVVIPPAAARNLARNLRQQLILSLIIGLFGGAAGEELIPLGRVVDVGVGEEEFLGLPGADEDGELIAQFVA
jgi:hypothetical protein